MTEQFSHEDIQKMRHIIAQHDSDSNPIRTIDLNNPPKEPYRYQEFPKMVYDLENSKPGSLVTMVVRDQNEFSAAIEDGWSKEAPSFGDGLEEDLSPQYQAEANRVQAQIDAENAKRKPGRKPKVQAA